jgi:hypothetical protein|tara:strand:+ start:97 stop:576 length:480 start_codon:yes stop_codon:yes gene_type:complete
MTKFILKTKGVINMSKPKIPMIVISVFLLINAVPMIMIPVAFDKDYIEDNMKSPNTEEGKVYEGLAAHNKAGLGAAFAALAIVLLMHLNHPSRVAKRILLSVGLGLIGIFVVIGLGGLRGLVDAPPMIPLIMGAIIGGVSIWVYNTPDDVESVISKEEE